MVVIANEKIITPKWQFTVALPEKSNLVFTFFFFWITHWCKNKKLEEWLPNSAKRKKEIESDTWKSFPSSDSKMRALIFTYFHAYWSSKGYSEVFLIHNRKLCHFNWPIISYIYINVLRISNEITVNKISKFCFSIDSFPLIGHSMCTLKQFVSRLFLSRAR